MLLFCRVVPGSSVSTVGLAAVLPPTCPSLYIALRMLFCAHSHSARYSRQSKPTDTISGKKILIFRSPALRSPAGKSLYRSAKLAGNGNPDCAILHTSHPIAAPLRSRNVLVHSWRKDHPKFDCVCRRYRSRGTSTGQ